MKTCLRLALLGAVVCMMLPATASAQYFSELVGFNGPPMDEDDVGGGEMFREPQWSPSTAGIVENPSGEYTQNDTLRASGKQTEGAAALNVFFMWEEFLLADEMVAADPDAWVRLTTFEGPIRPNPSLHLDGKVRFEITNSSEFFYGQLGLCLGIRETGANVPQMYDGGATGDVEWVGVDTTPNGIIAGTNGLVETTASGDDVQEYAVGFDIDSNSLPTGTAVISAGVNGVIDTVPAGDDQIRFGYFIGTNGARVPIPALVVPVMPIPATVEFDLSTGQARINGGSWVGGIAPFTGDGVLSAENDRGTLEHIGITNLEPEIYPTYFGLVDFTIDELQFEAPIADPVLAPIVLAPIIRDDVEVTVTSLAIDVDQVSLYVDHGSGPELVEARSVSNNNDVVFDITSAPAQTGDVYSATQRANGITSDFSSGVPVLPEPSPYSFSILLDEGGTGSCDYTTGGWEWVGITGMPYSYVPQGQPLFIDDTRWQTVDVRLDEPDKVIAGLGGNGELEPSESGYYTMDSVWFSIAAGANSNGMGPHEVFIDAVQVINSNGEISETILDMEDGVNRLRNPRGQSPTTPTSSELSDAAAFDGLSSHQLLWTYDTMGPNDAVGMLQRINYTCGTSALIPDSALGVRFHMLCRGPATAPDIPLPEIVGPIVGAQEAVRVNCDIDATQIDLYVDGIQVDSISTNGVAYVDFTELTLEPGQSISATQVVDSKGTSDFAYPRVVAVKPLPPTIDTPIYPGATEISVSNVHAVPHAMAYAVWIYAGTVDAGNMIAADYANGTDKLTLILSRPLIAEEPIVAVQTVNDVDSDPSAPVYVGIPGPMLYQAPAAGDSTVRVMDLIDQADLVTVHVGTTGVQSFSAVPASGADYVDVPVSGLVAGKQVTATMSIGGIPSGPSAPEIVTTNVETTILCDPFEYANQAAFEAQWPIKPDSSGYPANPGLSLSEDQNNTVGGAKSLFSDGNTGNWRLLPVDESVVASREEPIVWTTSIYDADGPGVDTRQFVDLDGRYWWDTTGSYFMFHLGLWPWSPTNNNYYALRIFGSGGPGWLSLDQYDAPMRSIGWHTFTLVYKGDATDVYIDKKLALKNQATPEGVELAVARVGAYPYGNYQMYADDWCMTVGPVRFPEGEDQPPAPPSISTPIEDGDIEVTIDGIEEEVLSVAVYDESDLQIGSYTLTAADTNGMVTVELTRPLVHLERITATQTNVVAESIPSDEIEVGIGNGAVLLTLGIREDASYGGGIEWIGAANTSGLGNAPQGIAINPSNSWRTVSFDPLTDPIMNFYLGNGVINGSSGTLEHLAVAVNSTSSKRSSGAYRLFIDNVYSGSTLITDFEGYDLGAEVLFQEPTYSGTTLANLSYPPSYSVNNNDLHNGGERAQELGWFFKNTEENRWVRITTAGAANLSSPTIDLSEKITMDVLLLAGCENKGDLNGDCKINTDDLADFEACLSAPGVSAGVDCICGDWNEDGDVDLYDFGQFQIYFTGDDLIPGCTP